jgi:hypothetical protein
MFAIVRYWHIASFTALQYFGSYWGISGHVVVIAVCPRDRLLLVRLAPIRPRVSAQVTAALAPQPRAE